MNIKKNIQYGGSAVKYNIYNKTKFISKLENLNSKDGIQFLKNTLIQTINNITINERSYKQKLKTLLHDDDNLKKIFIKNIIKYCESASLEVTDTTDKQNIYVIFINLIDFFDFKDNINILNVLFSPDIKLQEYKNIDIKDPKEKTKFILNKNIEFFANMLNILNKSITLICSTDIIKCKNLKLKKTINFFYKNTLELNKKILSNSSITNKKSLKNNITLNNKSKKKNNLNSKDSITLTDIMNKLKNVDFQTKIKKKQNIELERGENFEERAELITQKNTFLYFISSLLFFGIIVKSGILEAPPDIGIGFG
jgi:hypothetical protein